MQKKESQKNQPLFTKIFLAALAIIVVLGIIQTIIFNINYEERNRARQELIVNNQIIIYPGGNNGYAIIDGISPEEYRNLIDQDVRSSLEAQNELDNILLMPSGASLREWAAEDALNNKKGPTEFTE